MLKKLLNHSFEHARCERRIKNGVVLLNTTHNVSISLWREWYIYMKCDRF